MVRNWYARFPHITENADNLITNAEEAVEALKTGKIGRNVKPGEKRTQQCLPTTPNIAGCYMLRPFAQPVACCWEFLR